MARSIAICFAAFALIVALGAQAQTAKWDQAAVTAAAAEYETAVSGLREAIRKSSAVTMPGSNQTKAKMYQIMQDLRQIEWLAQTLHADLVKGEGIEATTPVYMQILANRELARSDAMFVDVDAFVQPKLDAARAAMTKLGAFYPTAPKP